MKTSRILGICDACADYIDAKSRFEELCVERQVCNGCAKQIPCSAYRVEGFLGDDDCSDCLTMTHCEIHHKVEGLYPPGPTE